MDTIKKFSAFLLDGDTDLFVEILSDLDRRNILPVEVKIILPLLKQRENNKKLSQFMDSLLECINNSMDGFERFSFSKKIENSQSFQDEGEMEASSKYIVSGGMSSDYLCLDLNISASLAKDGVLNVYIKGYGDSDWEFDEWRFYDSALLEKTHLWKTAANELWKRYLYLMDISGDFTEVPDDPVNLEELSKLYRG